MTGDAYSVECDDGFFLAPGGITEESGIVICGPYEEPGAIWFNAPTCEREYSRLH